MRKMWQTVASCGMALACVSFCSSVMAGPILNAGFEATSLSGWTAQGDASSQAAGVFGVQAAEGNRIAVLTTLGQSESSSGIGTPYSGTYALERGVDFPFIGADLSNPAYAAWYCQYLLTSGSPCTAPVFMSSGPYDAGLFASSSAVKQSFDAVAGTVLTVDWNLVTLDGTFDGAILALSSTDGVGYFTASLLKGFGDITGSTLCSHASFASGPTFCDAFGQGTESGWRSSSFVIPFSGTFTFAAAVGEGPDGWVPTALALDNIRVQQVSEPATLVLALLGLGVLPIWRRYNRLCH